MSDLQNTSNSEDSHNAFHKALSRKKLAQRVKYRNRLMKVLAAVNYSDHRGAIKSKIDRKPFLKN